MSNFLVGRNLADPSYDVFSGNGAQTGFTLTTQSSTAAATVTISGVTQRPSTDFTISGTTLTFTTAPASGTNNVLVQYNKAYVVGTPGDATVTTAKLADDAVTTAKIGDDAVTLAKMAAGTAGNLITYDASGNPAAVATGTVGQVLTSGGAGVAPTMQDVAGATYTPSTKQATTSGSVTFSDVPAGCKMFFIALNEVSGTAASPPTPRIQLGDAGGIETTGYISTSTVTLGSDGSALTDGFAIRGVNSASKHIGIFTFVLQDASTNTWIAGYSGRLDAALTCIVGGGSKSLSSELTQIKILDAGALDAGSVNIMYFEG